MAYRLYPSRAFLSLRWFRRFLWYKRPLETACRPKELGIAALDDKLRAISKDIPPSVVVFLIALPLSMGIARASGMPASLGLITAVVGGVVVAFLGGAPLQISGPSAGLSVLVLEWVVEYRTDADPYGITSIAIIVMLAGLIQAVAGFLKFGTYFRAVSPAVIRGMLAGIGIIIVVRQFHVMIDNDIEGSVLYNIYEIPAGMLKTVTTGGERTHYIAALIGVGTLLTIVLWDRFRPARLHYLPGALAGVLVASLAAAVFRLPIDYVDVKESLFSYVTLPTVDSLSRAMEVDILISGVALAFVASAETLLCATAVSNMRRGERTNYDRELAAQGIGNLACGFLGSLPITGVISRSTANVQAGAQTGWSSVMQGTWVFLFAALLPGLLGLMPESALAAIVIYVGFRLFQVSAPRKLLEYGWPVFGIYLATVIGIVAIDLLTGIVIGLVISTARLVYSLAHLDIERIDTDDRIELHLHGAATFLALPLLAGALEEIPPGSELHMHFDELDFIDHACLDLIASFQERHKETGGEVIMEWRSLIGRYTRGGIRAAARRSAPAIPTRHDK
ncbi:MAG: SulP family inorganic anion transporter [Myxococcales bacterium]|nr:MAG: SulP family inorganic anion transporter [Myxococcales bacterium]